MVCLFSLLRPLCTTPVVRVTLWAGVPPALDRFLHALDNVASDFIRCVHSSRCSVPDVLASRSNPFERRERADEVKIV